LPESSSDFPTLDFEGSAEEPNMGIFITFNGRNGEFDWEEDEAACEECTAGFEEDERDEILELTV
jgi:hypothetical protein